MNVVPFRLGNDLLSRMRIYISVIRQKVYISTLATPAADEGPSVEVNGPP
jgi:hypothetical protein